MQTRGVNKKLEMYHFFFFQSSYIYSQNVLTDVQSLSYQPANFFPQMFFCQYNLKKALNATGNRLY